MSTQPTNLPVPSESPRDLKFNAGKFDEFVTSESHVYVDRFGDEHCTIAGINDSANQAMLNYGYITKKSFEIGATLDTPNTVLQWESDGEFYRWDGDWSQPKVVPPGSTPESTGGVGPGKWLSVGDTVLRQQINSADGFKLVGAASSYAILKTIVPGYNGQRIQLREYAAGTGYGGGVFVAVNYAYTDDSGIHASVNSSWHWRREFTGPATPEMFGGIPDGGADSVDAINRCLSYSSGSGVIADYTGTWKLSRHVFMPATSKLISSDSIKYTGAGKLIFSQRLTDSPITVQSNLAPINGGLNVNSGGLTGATARAKTWHQFWTEHGDWANISGNQGLEYYNGYYYVSYRSVAAGMGRIRRFAVGGDRDMAYGDVNIPINHAADLSYRPSTGKLYSCSGGTDPTEIYQLADDGKSIEFTYNFSSQGIGLGACIAVDQEYDFLILMTAPASNAYGGDHIFNFYDFANLGQSMKTFTVPNKGTPQGITLHNGIIYLFTSPGIGGKYMDGTHGVTMIDMSGAVVGYFNLSMTGEGEGICVSGDYGDAQLAVGVNTPLRVMVIPNANTLKSHAVTIPEPMAYQGNNVTGYPILLPFQIIRTASAAGSAWQLGSNAKYNNIWTNTVTWDATNERLVIGMRRNLPTTLLAAFANFQGNFFSFNVPLRCDLAFGEGNLYIYFRDMTSTTNALVDMATTPGNTVLSGCLLCSETMSEGAYNYTGSN